MALSYEITTTKILVPDDTEHKGPSKRLKRIQTPILRYMLLHKCLDLF